MTNGHEAVLSKSFHGNFLVQNWGYSPEYYMYFSSKREAESLKRSFVFDKDEPAKDIFIFLSPNFTKRQNVKM